MIRFFGSPASSSGRTHWLLEELQVPYEYRRVNRREGQTRTPEFLAMNPSGNLPFLQDGDIKLFESVAINFYLAEKYGGSLWTTALPERALIYQWSLWAVATLQPVVLDIMYHSAVLPEPERDARVVDRARASLPRYLQTLETSLDQKQYLVSDTFSVADINAASVVNIAPAVGFSLDGYPVTKAWLQRLKGRAAYQKAAAGG
ncbi:MAG TPA: glutathione S-transferase family protein [Polyangiaceae bacterium]|jgi:glutathione S-transferase|nr:glutathione S-transferase family protein [Polyangiaceae bacterium]